MFYKDIQGIIDEYAFNLNITDEYKKLDVKYNLIKIYSDVVMNYMLTYTRKLEYEWQILDCYEECYQEFIKKKSAIVFKSKWMQLPEYILNSKYFKKQDEYLYIENLFNWKYDDDKSQFLYDCALSASHYWDLEEVD